MDERKAQVLRAIVALYANDGEPIGSHLLSEYMDLAVSTATLRNEMAALTKLGLLEQPHTSAGRIPSSAGYRYYIDNLMGSAELTARQRQIIDDTFEGLDYDPQKLIGGVAEALSGQIGMLVVATTPTREDMCIVHFELTKVGRYAVAVLGVTSGGGVLTRVARTGCELNQQDVAAASSILNRTLCFVSAADADEALLPATETGSPLQSLLNAGLLLIREAGKPATAVEGLQHLLDSPELTERIPALLEMLDDRRNLEHYIIPPTGRLTVLLGADLAEHPLPGFAVMAQSYVAGSGLRGGLALVGPERMPYSKLAPVLEYYALLLGQAMTGSGKES